MNTRIYVLIAVLAIILIGLLAVNFQTETVYEDHRAPAQTED